jgi:SAM-dependent methyltransferase
MQNSYISQNQLNNAKLYTNRWDWLKTLPEGLNILEVGVGAGDYSNRILERNPNMLVLVDIFVYGDMMIDHLDNPRFGEGEGLDFINKRFSGKKIKAIQGNSLEVLPKMNEYFADKFDIIYIDANHEYENIVSDIHNSLDLLKESGTIVLNDYIIQDHNGQSYDVVFAVNNFLKDNPGWEVVGFTLDKDMFCDIHIKKILEV